MSGEDQRHHVVAQLGACHRRPIAVAGPQKHREDVLAIRARLLAALVDEQMDQPVHAGPVRKEARPRPPSGAMPQAGHRKRGARGHRQHRQHPLSQDGQALLRVILPPAEDPAQDDLQRQRAQARMQRDGDVSGPRGDRPAHGVEHPPRLPLDHASLQRGQHDPAPVQMLLLVEQHERARTDDRPDGRPALPRMQGLAGAASIALTSAGSHRNTSWGKLVILTVKQRP